MIVPHVLTLGEEMRFNQWMTCIAVGSIVTSACVFATGIPVHEQLQVPQCLAAKITTSYEVLAENEQFKIIDIADTDIDRLSHLADQVHCGRFVNVSHRITGTLLADKHQSAQRILQKKSVNSSAESRTCL